MYKKQILIFLFLILLIAIPVSAKWIQWIDCDDLFDKKIITPKNSFNSTEKICFYGAGFPGQKYTMVLQDPINKKTRTMQVPVINSIISSAWGYSLSTIEPGTYNLLGIHEGNYVCSNQDGLTHCIPSDISCTFWKFVGNTEKCGLDGYPSCEIDKDFVDSDSDFDNWTDSCDVFPNNALEWIDLDGDGIGNNIDDNDFNFLELIPPTNNTKETNQTGNNQTDPINQTLNETESGNTKPIGPSGGGFYRCSPEYECSFWSACINGIQTRTCEIINDCPGIDEITQRSCETAPIQESQDLVIPKSTDAITQDSNLEQNTPIEETETGLSQITGAATGIFGGNFNFYWVFLFAIFAIVIFIIIKKRRK